MDNNKDPNSQNNEIKEKLKPPKIEDKPFEEFINQHFIPQIKKSLLAKGQEIDIISLKKDQRPVVGGECWVVYGEFHSGRRFWITFNSESIKSLKNISLAESASEPGFLESFLIDEKKITLQLLTSRFLQRLNGQKWFGDN